MTGCAGYIAPRHMRAIKETGNRLVAAVDPNDSVGILDQFSFATRYFSEFERYDRHVEKLRRGKPEERIHFVSICSPNYLHDAHIRFALRVGADAICEKPIVINPWNIDPLIELEREFGKRVFTILQLRIHPSIAELRARLQAEHHRTMHRVTLTYVTPRGNWYLNSWKGSQERSGGLITNIGIHLFDLLLWLFGDCLEYAVHITNPRRAAGRMKLERADVTWFLSIDRDDLPVSETGTEQIAYRSINVDDQEIGFSDGFANLHTAMYREILAGRGFGLEDARRSIELTHHLRSAKPVGVDSTSHALARRIPPE